MQFRIYNAHPYKLSVGDCTKRSISLATGIPYHEVEKGLNDHKKITQVKRFYENPNPQSYMENVLNFRSNPVIIADGKHITVEDFANSHPVGRYVISASGHWTSCIDGVVYDTWDCTAEGVLSYYEITCFERTKVEKKYCFEVKRKSKKRVLVTVYDGNGQFSTKEHTEESSRIYINSLYEQGFFNYNEMGEYI